MRVVGGPSDGIDVWVGRDKKHIQLPDPVPNPDFHEGDPPNAVASYTIYTVRSAQAPRHAAGSTTLDGYDVFDPVYDQVLFLAPSDWSDMKAIRYQFTK